MKLALYFLIASIISICTYLVAKSYFDVRIKEEISTERSNQEAINYFNEICLGSEYGSKVPLTRKFKGKALIYIVKDSAYHEQVNFLDKVLTDFNRLTIDGFKIALTNDSSTANIQLYLCSDKLIKTRKRFNRVTADFYGYFDSAIKNSYIGDSQIFINVDKPLMMQKAAILEEVVQSVGFFNDSDLYFNSIFFQYKYDMKFKTITLSDLDKKIISFLYHPLMKPGLNRLQTVEVIREILRQKNN
ncbi:MAG: DUF2927 domain-containing protein [Bacteroidota bacterium]